MKTVIAGLEEGLNAIAEALEGGGGGGSEIVPTPTAQDEGKVLTANDDGTASWEDAQGGLPVITGDEDSGKFVMADWSVASGIGSYSLESVRQVTNASSETYGKVLTTDGFGGYGWQTPSGGGGSTVYVCSSNVEYDDKSNLYYVEFDFSNAPVTNYTKVISIIGGNKPITDYTAYCSTYHIIVFFDSNPNASSVEVLFVTPVNAS